MTVAESTVLQLCAEGFAAQEASDMPRALARFREAIALAPEILDIRFLLAFAEGAAGEPDAARQTLLATPGIETMSAADARRVADTATTIGADLAALRAVKRALHFAPHDPALHATLGALHHRLGEDDAAGALLDAAVARWPDHFAARMNRARLRADLGDFGGAEEDYTQALRVDPHHAGARRHRGLVRLTRGDHAQGWADHEARRLLPNHQTIEPALPPWRGESLAGRTVLLWAEQGLGDAIMGVRFAAPLAARGARVVVRCAAPLRRLLATAAGVSRVVGTDDRVADCDVHVPMLSVPALLGFSRDEDYGAAPYLTPPGGDASAPRALESSAPVRSGRRRIAVAWAGSPAHGNDHNRSLPAELLPPLLSVADVDWVSVQLGDRRRDLERLPEAMRSRVTDAASRLTDFADTAALLVGCDGLVTVDTSVAHLGGALGVPTNVLVPFAPDWRWQLGRTDSPWYGSVRLYRQPVLGDWAAVLTALARDLAPTT